MIGIVNAEELLRNILNILGQGRMEGLLRQMVFDMPRRRRKIVCVRNILFFNYRFRFQRGNRLMRANGSGIGVT